MPPKTSDQPPNFSTSSIPWKKIPGAEQPEFLRDRQELECGNQELIAPQANCAAMRVPRRYRAAKAPSLSATPTPRPSRPLHILGNQFRGEPNRERYHRITAILPAIEAWSVALGEEAVSAAIAARRVRQRWTGEARKTVENLDLAIGAAFNRHTGDILIGRLQKNSA